MPNVKGKYQRILLKLSGEALAGDEDFGVCLSALKGLVASIKEVKDMGVQIAIVVGGGNFFRGENLARDGFDRITADQMGMLSTVMNGLALRRALESENITTTLMSTIAIPSLVDVYNRNHALKLMDENHVMIFTAGVGTALFSTDSAASLRAIDMGADILLKASTTDAVYSEDPKKNPQAERYEHLNYQFVIEKQLGVMDMTAFCLCQEHSLPIRVFNAQIPGVLKAIVEGKQEGTLIDSEG